MPRKDIPPRKKARIAKRKKVKTEKKGGGGGGVRMSLEGGYVKAQHNLNELYGSPLQKPT